MFRAGLQAATAAAAGNLLEIHLSQPHPAIWVRNSGVGAQQPRFPQALYVFLKAAKVSEPLGA